MYENCRERRRAMLSIMSISRAPRRSRSRACRNSRGELRSPSGSRGTRGRGRDSGCPLPPAQTRAGAPNAHGTCLGYGRLASKRTLGRFAHTLQPMRPTDPAPCPVRVRLWRVLLGLRPPLHNLRRRSLAFFRLLRQYYAAIRLPAAVHEGLIVHHLLPPARLLLAGGNGVSRFSRAQRTPGFSACLGSPTPQDRLRTRVSCAQSRGLLTV